MKIVRLSAHIIFICALVLINFQASAQIRAITNKVAPPALSLLSLSSSEVALGVTGLDTKVVKLTIQRREVGTTFRTLLSLRVGVTNQSSLTTSDNAPSTGKAFYRMRALLKTGQWTGWSKVLSVGPATTTPPSLSPPNPTSCDPQLLTDARSLVNSIRASNGLDPLVLNVALAASAQIHSARMAAKQALTHEGWSQEIASSGYQGASISQNIAEGFPTVQSTMDAWLASVGHRENILYSRWSETGFGCALDRYGRMWWTQNFGRQS